LNVRIYLLGTGTAIPLRRGLPCIVLKINSHLYVFDIGEGCQQRLINMGLSPIKIKSIFITHAHGDHYLGLFGLLQSMHLMDMKNPLNIVVPREIYVLLEEMIEMKLVKPGFTINPSIVREGGVYSDDNVKVYAFPVKHSIPAYGYLAIVKDKYRIVYTGDTMYCEDVVKHSQGAHLLIHEATFASIDQDKAREEKHSTAVDAAIAASKAGVKTLVLTHISPRYNDTSILYYDAYRYFKNTIVAEDYMTLII